MIQIKNLTFNYHKQKNLFDNLNLELETGNIYGLLGRNGAGKTSLLKLMAGMLAPVKGSATIDGVDAFKRLPSILQDIYFIPEEFELPSISANQLMKNIAGFYPKFSNTDYLKHMETFGVDANTPMNRLSFGQCKQIIVSFGLATNTRFLLLDEPTNGLDIPSKSMIRKMLASAISDERSFLISTHQVRDLENMIDPVIILNNGKVIFNQKIETINHKLSFHNLESLENQPVIYYETRFGGYAAICKNQGNDASELNIELLFNGIIHCPDDFIHLFNQ
jgi:ABC-2 type transport system ATP-binding protein